ncbi:MAG: signal peptide peptidase SppA [Longimicrobiales bacterium]
MAISGVVLAFLYSSNDGAGVRGFGDRIAILELNGTISSDAAFLRDLQNFRDDGSVKGFIVSINSPGGVVAPSQSIFAELKRLHDDSIPLYAVIGGVGASGGYYVALAADSIFAMPGSITGSIGVIMEFPDASGLMQKVGVQMQTVKSAEHKDIGSPFKPLSEEDRAILQTLITDVYNQFVTAVATERKLSVDSVKVLADGRILTGSQALHSGLIDSFGNEPDVIRAMGRRTKLGDDPKVVRPHREKNGFLGTLLGRTTASAVARAVQPLSEMAGPRLMYLTPW